MRLLRKGGNLGTITFLLSKHTETNLKRRNGNMKTKRE